ncbi:MAG: hypothetical protein H6703_06660 [Myxococcales bacterium]|nr:hypothetical protein [Myxococcales bacterium]
MTPIEPGGGRESSSSGVDPDGARRVAAREQRPLIGPVTMPRRPEEARSRQGAARDAGGALDTAEAHFREAARSGEASGLRVARAR